MGSLPALDLTTEATDVFLHQLFSSPLKIHAQSNRFWRREKFLAANIFKGFVMNFIVWLLVGGIIGWIASKVMNTDAQQGVILNVVVGIVGAFLGGMLISPLVGVPTINQNAFSIGAMLVSFVGAIILLAIVNLFRRGKAR